MNQQKPNEQQSITSNSGFSIENDAIKCSTLLSKDSNMR